MNSEQLTCLEWAQKDLTLGAYCIKASLQRLLASQEHAPLPPGAIDLRDDLKAMLQTSERLGEQFERMIMAVRRAPVTNQAHPIIAAAKIDYPDGQKLRAHFAAICREWSGHYCEGDAGFSRFVADIRQCVEAPVPA